MTNTAIYETVIGMIKIGAMDDKICEISFLNRLFVEDKAKANFMPSKLTDLAFNQLQEYLEGSRRIFELPLLLNGTNFQKQVWNELLNIPYGETRSYKQIAEAISNPKAVRAVGMANNHNPIAIVVPCHRVIGTNGKLIGYAGGLEIKRRLLEIEKSNFSSNLLF